MTTVLCPSALHELPVSPWQALVECPPCGTRAWVDDLTASDRSLCGCGHPARMHGPRHGLAYTCPQSTCPCTEPKEKPMPTTTTHPLTDRYTAMLWDALGLDAETVRSPHQQAVVATVVDRLDSDEVRELANVIALARRAANA